MDEAVLRLRVGLFVLIAMVILVILIFYFSEGWKSQYVIYVKPERAPGVTVDTPIRKNGILIGRVADVTTQDDHVILTLRINQDVRIYENEICSIGSESILGDSVVEILHLPKDERGKQVKADHQMTEVSIRRDPMEIVTLALNLEEQISQTLTAVQEAGQAVNDAGRGIETITQTVQDAISDEDSDVKKMITDIKLMSQKAQAAADNFNRFFDNINEFVGDPENKAQIKNALKELPEILKEIRTTVADTRDTINSYREISKRVGKNFENIEPFTESLKKNGPEILEQINGSLGNVDGLIAQIESFTKNFGKLGDNFGESLNNPDSTINKFLNDKKLYNDIAETVQKIKDLSVKLEPLLNDARTFTDSIARDPSQLGIKGALNRNPPGSGYKGSAGRDRMIRQ